LEMAQTVQNERLLVPKVLNAYQCRHFAPCQLLLHKSIVILLTFVGQCFFLHTSTTKSIIAARVTATTGIPIFRALSNVCDVTSIPLKILFAVVS